MTTPDELGQELLLELRKSANAVDNDKIDGLIAAGANLSALNDQGQPPLILSIAHGFRRASLALIAGGANVELGSTDSPPLHLAAYYGAASVFRALVDKGAKLDRLDARGRTPVHVAQAKRLQLEEKAKKFPRLTTNIVETTEQIDNLHIIERTIENILTARARAAQLDKWTMERWRDDGLPLTRPIAVRKKPVSFKK